MTFALGLAPGSTPTPRHAGALFAAFGATLIDGEGKSQLKSDAMRQVLEFAQKLVKSIRPTRQLRRRVNNRA